MRWERDSQTGAAVLGREHWTADRIAMRDEELNWLMRHERRNWKLINGNIVRKGDPTMMAEGTYGALAAYPPPAALTQLSVSATEQLLIPSAMLPVYTPLPINGVLAPQAYRLVIAGRYTTAVTASPTFTTSIRIGNAITSPLLGTSAAATATISLTNAFWRLVGDITITQIGAPGSNSKALGLFAFDVNTAVGGASSTVIWGTSAGTAVAFDSTIAAGTTGGCIAMNVLSSVTTATMIIDQIHFMDWN